MQYAKMNREFRKIYRNIANILAMIYVMMTFSVLFVKPSWCQSFEEQIPSKLPADAKEYPECTRFIGEEGKVVEYHRSNVPLFNSFTVSVFCWVGYASLLLFQAIKVYYERNLNTTGTFFIMSTVGAVDVCIVVFWPSKAADLTAVLRICFVVAMSSILRSSLKRFITVIFYSTPVILLYLINLSIWALIARALFYGMHSSDSDVPDINPEVKGTGDHYLVNFTNWWKTMYTLFILSTLDNFPDVMLGIVNSEPVLLLFFFFFTIISGIIMLSIMTGVFYTHFKDLYSASVDTLVSQKNEYKILIQLCLQDKILNFDKVHMILDKYLMYRKEEIDRKRKTSDNSVETNEKMRGSVIHYLVNQFGNRKIKKEDIDIFQTFYNITSGTTEVINGHDIQMINRRHKDATLEVQEYLDMIDSENFLEKLVKAWYTALFFTINDFIIALLPVIQLEYYKSDKLPPNCYLICEILNVVALMDPIINYKSNKNLFYRKLIMFKLYTTLTLIILSNILQFANIPIASTEVKANKTIYYAWCIVSLLKITSIHDLLKFSNEYKLIIETITQIVPLLGDLFIQLLLLMLFYGVLGVYFFGGLINSTTKEAYDAALGNNLQDNYEYLSFNDIPSGLLFLYSIMITNDWSRLMSMAICTLSGGSKVFWARSFFLSFFGLGFMLVLNTTIGAIIDFINTYLSILREEEESSSTIETLKYGNPMQIGSSILDILRSRNSPLKKLKMKRTKEIGYQEENTFLREKYTMSIN